MFKPSYPVLADDRVRWVGDPVAFVVAETQAQAADAAELIAVRLQNRCLRSSPPPRQLSLMLRRSGTVARTTSASSN
jgi:hypothetical protein